MCFTILLPEKIAAEGRTYLEERGYVLKTGRGMDRETLIEDLADCDGVIVRVAVIDEAVFKARPRLKVVAKHGVGVDNIDLEAARRYGRRVVNVPAANTLSVAEQTMALILACAKKIKLMTSRYAEGDVKVKDRVPTSEIGGKVLGLAGFGRIGSAVAEMAKRGFSMRVLAYDPFLSDGAVLENAERVTEWERLFRESDFVSVHMPLTKETEKIVGEREFRLMKPGAYLINTARGRLVDEEALIRALRERRLRGAGLDVSDPEPADPSNPLFSMDEVIMTPHNAASTEEAMVRMAFGAARGIDEILSGKDPTYPVV